MLKVLSEENFGSYEAGSGLDVERRVAGDDTVSRPVTWPFTVTSVILMIPTVNR